jgi:hypothetical protein
MVPEMREGTLSFKQVVKCKVPTIIYRVIWRWVLNGLQKPSALPALRYGRSPGSQFCNALLIPKRIAPTCPALNKQKINLEEM